MKRGLYNLVVLLLLATAAGVNTARADDLADLEEQAIREAVQSASAAVVQIDTIGGREQVAGELVGSGPTTGLVVGSDGWIVSSAFNFRQQPTSIIVTLPDGTRLPATRVATDHSRMLVLLRVETDEPLATALAVPHDEVRSGQWAIAVGRTFGSSANVSVGVVSATRRMMGKMIQTDAKISPSNYGGPLIDLHGRTFGVLVPMAPQAGGKMAESGLYDAGIGFAAPLETIFTVLPKLQAGEDLHQGLLGVGLAVGDSYQVPPQVTTVTAQSPASEAGLEPGDVIVEIDDVPVATVMQMKMQLGSRYAGETIRLALRRGEERIEREATLVDKVPPFDQGFLGVLPMRDPPEKDASGVVVRYVYTGSPAAEAGIKPGDRIVKIGVRQLRGVAEAIAAMRAVVAGDAVEVAFAGEGGQSQSKTLHAVSFPEQVPAELPAARGIALDGPVGVRTGLTSLRLPQFPRECKVYVPETYRAAVPHGVVLWLHPSGGVDEELMVQRWQELCEQRSLIVVAPPAEDASRWQQSDAAFVVAVLEKALVSYNVDPRRIVSHGLQAGGAMAYKVALEQGERVRGVAAIDAPLPSRTQVPAVEPNRPLAVFTTQSSGSRFAKRIEQSIKAFRAAKYPVTVQQPGAEARYLSPEELAELGRWIDSLDRF